MKNHIIKIAKEQKISDIGFCDFAEYSKEAEALKESTVFGKKQAEPEILKNARTVIVCAFNYYAGTEKGNISRYAQGEDYHITVIKKMEPIADFLKESGFSAQIFADTGFLNERMLAVQSGIAFIGRNRMAISPKFGSYFFIGYLLTDCEIKKDKKCEKKCENCGKCEEVCPLGALWGGFSEEKCLSYITQKKGDLTGTEAEAVKNAKTVWGCDLCQEVCPHNRDIPVTEIDEFKKNRIINLEISEEISNREFKKIYGNRAFSWRVKGVILRNQKILQKS